MAKIRYVGELPHAHWQGATYPQGEWVEDHGLEDCQLDLLAGNPTFEVDGHPAESEVSQPAEKLRPGKVPGA
jgi:hypothetical protein